MSLVAILRHGLRLLVPLAVAQTLYLYLYPVFLGCAFPLPTNATYNGTAAPDTLSDAWPAFLEAARPHLPIPVAPGSKPAPFRLLALGDPQLEGDTSIPNAVGPRLPHFKKLIDHVTLKSSHTSLRERVRHFLHDYVDLLLEDIPDEIESVRKHVDLFGNDFYLAHIYRTVHWWTNPTHVTVLGDLLGSQWIKDDEFDRRGDRYWNRVFRGAERVPDELMAYPEMEYELAAILGGTEEGDAEDAAAWTHRSINVAGNHDIGYAGDITKARLDRFERVYGKANYELRFELPVTNDSLYTSLYDEDENPESDLLPPELRIVVLNDMNLDTPARESSLQDDTYAFLNDVIRTSTAVDFKGHFTIVLTHIPLHKREGVCVDAPLFSFHDGGSSSGSGRGVKEQNMLSGDASKGFLEGIFGMSGDPRAPGGGTGRPGVVLNGHDHEGCDTYHFIRQVREGNRFWDARPWHEAVGAGGDGGNDSVVVDAEGVAGIREMTVRSMMGDFGGNAGLLSAWFDEESWSWKFEYGTCALGKQHFWWVVHILDIVTVVMAIAYAVMKAIEAVARRGTGTGKAETTNHLTAARPELRNAQVVTSKHGHANPAPSSGDVRTRR